MQHHVSSALGSCSTRVSTTMPAPVSMSTSMFMPTPISMPIPMPLSVSGQLAGGWREAATRSPVHPLRFSLPTSAPCFSSTLAHSRWPSVVARCRGVRPRGSSCSMSACQEGMRLWDHWGGQTLPFSALPQTCSSQTQKAANI